MCILLTMLVCGSCSDAVVNPRDMPTHHVRPRSAYDENGDVGCEERTPPFQLQLNIDRIATCETVSAP
jgi:hypothetical protein